MSGAEAADRAERLEALRRSEYAQDYALRVVKMRAQSKNNAQLMKQLGRRLRGGQGKVNDLIIKA